MRTHWRGGLLFVVIGVTGCLGDESGRDPFAFRNPFKQTNNFDPVKAPAATAKAATRVHAIGTEIVAANGKDLGIKPIFFAMGGRDPAIFHKENGMVILTEGLIERCTSDDELAAVLCHELGKMAAEHAEKAPPRHESDVPPAPRWPSDVVGGSNAPDQTRLAEEALYDRRGPRNNRAAREPRPDPRTLGQNIFTKAGHNSDDFARVDELVKEAEGNGEKRDVMRGR
jgi:Peptidase family M48